MKNTLKGLIPSAQKKPTMTRTKITWLMFFLSAALLRAGEGRRPDGPGPATRTNAPDAAAKPEGKKEDAKPPVGAVPDATHKPVFTPNTVTIAGTPVRYVTETGMLPLLKPDGSARASVFYIAYVKEGETNASARP